MVQGEPFDVDKLYLTKPQLHRIGDKLIAGWTKTGRPGNLKLIYMTKAIQFLMKNIPEEACQQYYKDFFREAFAVMQDNALSGMPELKQLKEIKDKQDEKIISELDFSIKKVLAKRMPHWPGLGEND